MGGVIYFNPQILSLLRCLGCIWRIRDLLYFRGNEGMVSVFRFLLILTDELFS